jgi:hypothetical protein
MTGMSPRGHGVRGKKLPAILCWHGHGPFGKEALMGNDSSPELRDHVQRLNYNYGHQMAKAGFITFAIDWMGMGERREDLKPIRIIRQGYVIGAICIICKPRYWG